LIQLRKLGVKEPSLLKAYLRDFENYMKTNYGLDILKEESDESKIKPPKLNRA
jgi:hypothetical protein